MIPGFSEPGFLLLGFLALIPGFWRGPRAAPCPGLFLLPPDALSVWLDRLLRLSGVMALLGLTLGLSGPYLPGQTVEHTGEGAEIVLLMDRSSSMGENFSGKYLGGSARESKGVAAQQLLAELVARRPHDLFAMLNFSAAPIHVMPMTDDHSAIQAAIAAVSERGHGITHIAPALALALETFGNRVEGGSRIVLLVSDGAARIDEDTQERLRIDFHNTGASLYWIYLRTPKSTHLGERPANPGESTTPEYFLHRYFQELGIPYRAFEAENPGAVQEAVTELATLKPLPWRYFESLPRRDLSGYGYATALFFMAVLLIGILLEDTANDRRPVNAPPQQSKDP